jgi:hypothetical protein
MAIINEYAITKLIPTKKNTVISLIMASFILAIANSSNLQFADAQKSSDEPDIKFIEQFGTSRGDDARGVFVDSSGGVYVVGFTFGTFPDQTNEGGQDAFLAKFATDDEDKKKHDGDNHDKKKHNDHDAEKKH